MSNADRKRFKAIEEEAAYLKIKVRKVSTAIFFNHWDKWEVFTDFIHDCTEPVPPGMFCGSGPSIKSACFNALAEWCRARQKARRGSSTKSRLRLR